MQGSRRDLHRANCWKVRAVLSPAAGLQQRGANGEGAGITEGTGAAQGKGGLQPYTLS